MVISSASLPVIDLAVFVAENGGDQKRVEAVEEIGRACSESGFFQVVNHGIPVALLKEALHVYREFFHLSYEEQVKLLPRANGVWYFRSPTPMQFPDFNMVISSASLPVIDLAVFLAENGGERKRAVAVEEIGRACSESGFFQVVNHGIPVALLKDGLNVYREFFDLSHEEKVKLLPKTGGVGYFRSPNLSMEGNEHFLILSPHLGYNPYPSTFPKFQQVLEEIFPKFGILASLTESILNQALGLPVDTLKQYNSERGEDFLNGLHYFPATETEIVGKSAHSDTGCFTILCQDDVGGLEIHNNGEWVPVPPEEGALIINVGDALRVLSNYRFKSATHRVRRAKGKDRYSFAFFHNMKKDKWVEPLQQFTKHIGELPKFRGFAFEEYIELRSNDRKYPPNRYEDLTRITRYAINHDLDDKVIS